MAKFRAYYPNVRFVHLFDRLATCRPEEREPILRDIRALMRTTRARFRTFRDLSIRMGRETKTLSIERRTLRATQDPLALHKARLMKYKE